MEDHSEKIDFNIQLDNEAYLPVRAHNTDVGYDVRCIGYSAVDHYTLLAHKKSLGLEGFRLVTSQDNDEWEDINEGKVPVRWGVSLDSTTSIAVCRPKYIIARTGVHVQPADDRYYIEAVPNSRVGKRPIILGNSIGIIDPGYTGEVLFIYKVMPWATEKEIEEFFADGNVIGQFIARKRYGINFNVVDKLESTERGDGGFGSTAK